MANLIKGRDVADQVLSECAAKVSENITSGKLAPKLCVVSIGDDDSNSSYLRGIHKSAGDAGIIVKTINLDTNVTRKKVAELMDSLNKDDKIQGILLMRPFPKDCSLDEHDVCEMISSIKDVDCAKQSTLTSTYISKEGIAPCTAEACVKMLEYKGVNLEGANVVVIGRSLVVGKPVANLLLNKNATVTMCHSKTKNMQDIVKSADIVIVATGTPKKFDGSYFRSGQIVIDAGINWDNENNKLCGDVDFESVESIVSDITPVPGGVGTVTSAVLMSHVIN